MYVLEREMVFALHSPKYKALNATQSRKKANFKGKLKSKHEIWQETIQCYQARMVSLLSVFNTIGNLKFK